MRLESDQLHDNVMTTLNAAIEHNTFSTAYMLTGVRGVGKRSVALHIAQALNCENKEYFFSSEACSCRSCTKIEHETHPDVFLLGDDLAERSIKIEMIRELQSWVRLKPFEGRYKVAVIREAERLTTEAQNALLKTLEEPPAQTVLVLTAVYPLQLLPTILSRVSELRLTPLAVERVAHRLKEKFDSGDEAYYVAYISQGSMEIARTVMTSEDLLFRSELLRHFFSGTIEEYLYTLEKKPYGELQERVKTMVLVCMIMVRDLMTLVSAPDAAEQTIVHRDFMHELRAKASACTATQLFAAMDMLQKAQQYLRQNGNVKIVFAQCMVTINTLSDAGRVQK